MKKIFLSKPFIIFFTGMSASGKSSISNLLIKRLKNLKIKKIINLDGDTFRKKYKNFSYNTNNRNIIGNHKIKFAKKYLNKKYTVIISGIGHDKFWRKKIKKTTKDYFEIYLKCPIKVCEKRDIKNQYIKAKKGLIKNFVGFNLKYQEGKSHDLTINTSRLTITKSVTKVLTFLKNKKYVFQK